MCVAVYRLGDMTMVAQAQLTYFQSLVSKRVLEACQKHTPEGRTVQGFILLQTPDGGMTATVVDGLLTSQHSRKDCITLYKSADLSRKRRMKVKVMDAIKQTCKDHLALPGITHIIIEATFAVTLNSAIVHFKCKEKYHLIRCKSSVGVSVNPSAKQSTPCYSSENPAEAKTEPHKSLLMDMLTEPSGGKINHQSGSTVVDEKLSCNMDQEDVLLSSGYGSTEDSIADKDLMSDLTSDISLSPLEAEQSSGRGYSPVTNEAEGIEPSSQLQNPFPYSVAANEGFATNVNLDPIQTKDDDIIMAWVENQASFVSNTNNVETQIPHVTVPGNNEDTVDKNIESNLPDEKVKSNNELTNSNSKTSDSAKCDKSSLTVGKSMRETLKVYIERRTKLNQSYIYVPREPKTTTSVTTNTVSSEPATHNSFSGTGCKERSKVPMQGNVDCLKPEQDIQNKTESFQTFSTAEKVSCVTASQPKLTENRNSVPMSTVKAVETTLTHSSYTELSDTVSTGINPYLNVPDISRVTDESWNGRKNLDSQLMQSVARLQCKTVDNEESRCFTTLQPANNFLYSNSSSSSAFQKDSSEEDIHERTDLPEQKKGEDIYDKDSGREFPSACSMKEALSDSTSVPREKLALSYTEDKTSTKRYICNLCSTGFTRLGSLKMHFASIHNKIKRFRCQHCGQGFSRKGNLTRHELSHAEGQEYPCEMCGKKFKVLLYLRNHIQRHHRTREKKYECPVCMKRFLTTAEQQCHLESHQAVNSGKHVCHRCGLHLKNKYSKRKHLLKCHKGNKEECKNCLQKFSTNEELFTHLSTNCQQSHTCNVCGKSFMEEENLAKHVQVHTHYVDDSGNGKNIDINMLKERLQNACVRLPSENGVNSSFVNDNKWQHNGNTQDREEMENSDDTTNTGNKIEMEQCSGKSFDDYRESAIKELSNLKNADIPSNNESYNKAELYEPCQDTQTEGLTAGKAFQCDVCQKQFGEMRYLRYHLRTHMDRSLQCAMCPRKFKTKSNLLQHMNTGKCRRRYACKVCGEEFLTHREQRQHAKVHTQTESKPRSTQKKATKPKDAQASHQLPSRQNSVELFHQMEPLDIDSSHMLLPVSGCEPMERTEAVFSVSGLMHDVYNESRYEPVEESIVFDTIDDDVFSDGIFV